MWHIYEAEKKKLQELCKTSEEYEEKIKELVKRLENEQRH